jgi:hypothetical protein
LALLNSYIIVAKTAKPLPMIGTSKSGVLGRHCVDAGSIPFGAVRMARKELIQILRDKRALALALILPLTQLIPMGSSISLDVWRFRKMLS